MSDHKKLWESVCTTDPRAVKPITGKSYQGNSPKPYWLIERATETFGPVGIGWGCTVKSERFEKVGPDDVLHVAVVSVWYVLDGKRSETFDQMGGTKAAYRTADKVDRSGVVTPGRLMVDEDAGKKSVTDGMVKCLSMIGFAGDIFSGRWDDSKYVAEARAHYAEPEQATPTRQPARDSKRTGVMADVLASLPPLTEEDLNWYRELAANVEDLFASKGQAVAYDRVTAEKLENEQMMYLWAQLGSKVRSALKIEKGLRIGAA